MTTVTESVEPQGMAYAPTELRRFAAALFRGAGLELDKPDVVADGLLESDLLGHTTHGLALAPRYLKEIASGSMTTEGEPGVVSDRGACVCWDGKRLPGVWLATKAIDLRDRHRGHRQQSPHRMSRRVSSACDGEGLHGHRVWLRPIAKERRPVRGYGSGVHTQSDRRRHPH